MIQKIREKGLVYSFAIMFNRIVPARIFRYRRFVIFQLKPAESINPHTHVKTSWCESDEDFEESGKVTYYSRSSDSEMAVRADYDGVIAGAMWATVEQFVESELGISIAMEKNQTWLYAARVDDAFRRKGVFAQILDCIRKELAQRGLTHQLVCVNPHNIGSVKAHSRCSFYTPGSVRVIRFYKTTFCLAQGDVSCDRFVSWNSDKNPIQVRIPSKEVPG
jgi:GNAT superfamily N-acetyltransferase